MARADEIRARYESELAMAEAEDDLIAAKGRKNISADDLRAKKDALRAARQAYREQREAEDPGEGVARPAPIKASGSVRPARTRRG